MEKKRRKSYLFLILSILIISIFIPYAASRMYQAVIENVQTAGDERAHVYGLNEVITVRRYETVLEAMEYQLRPENRTEDCSAMIRDYLAFAMDTMDLGEIDLYAVIDGGIYAALEWEGRENFNPENAEWYQKAMAADGDIIYTDVYEDVRLKRDVVTLAMKIRGTDDVVAVDIYPAHEAEMKGEQDAPEGTNYYICDSVGTLLSYSLTELNYEELQERFDGVFREIIENVQGKSDSRIIGVDGLERGAYYYRLDSGWYAVVTIPYEALWEPYAEAWKIFIGVITVFVLTVILFAVTDFRTSRKAAVYNEIIGVLGNSYYALYQIDLRADRYYMMKGSDYVRVKIPRKGNYSELLAVMREVIREDDYGEFCRVFSSEGMEKLVKRRVRDFGGDFKRKFNGEYRWVHVQMLYDESLQKGTVVLAFRDVNEAKEQDLSRLELLKNSLEAADNMAKSKNIFFSQMSHDMRTPLNGIIGLTDLAENNVDDPSEIRDTLGKIRRLGKQLLELINDILDMSRIEAGKLELRSESFDLKKNLEDLVSLYRSQIEAEGKRLIVKFEFEDTEVVGDWGKLQQILNNILSNAFKFTGRDGVIELDVGEIRDTNSQFRKYCFRIRDNGAGMSREFLDKLFVPFEREVQFGAAKVAGTGLGMPIVRELVQKMDGTIAVESALGEGSLFEITIPFRVSGGKTGGSSEIHEERGPAGESGEGETQILAGKRILVAEDNTINMEIMTEMLGSFGAETASAWDGRQAVELYEAQEPGYFDLILLDMQMPVMDGCEAAVAIRRARRPDSRRIPIIAVTANAFAEDIALTKKAGMNAHISKPIDFRILKDTMEKLILERQDRAEE
ncbi:hybrid sensor histidine kinase/response regulator [Lachnoclostridium sp. An169]|uniref:hybrid sensor histidine kinase/response regulator n=1 Tax=Lachnoclostridium sp. An169 TaxID=1965569 RepID=UPI00111CD862|nr:hybrid sensor histidine kinase/response regulator [Lachnoclostridium sp. An169]